MELNDWNDAEKRVERAQELFEQRRLLEALDELRAATDLNPYNPAWHFNIGLTLDELGRTEEAVDAYQRALEIDPDEVQTLNHLGIDQHRLGQYREALATFDHLAEVDAAFEASYCNRILTYTELNQHERAEEMFYLARLYREECPHCYFNIAISLMRRGLYQRAIYCLQRTMDLQGSHPRVHVRLADAFWHLNQLDHARRHFLAALRQDPGNTSTLLDLAELLMEMNRWDEAGEKIRRAIELAPHSAAARCDWGKFLLDRKRYEEAITALQHALDRDPTFPTAHLMMGKAFIVLRNPQEAKKHFRCEMMLRPDDPELLLELSNHLIDLGELRSGILCLRKLVGEHTEHAIGWQNLAAAYFLNGNHAEGIECSREALRYAPGNVMAIHNLSLALLETDRADQAWIHLRGALDIDPENVHLLRLQLRLRLHRTMNTVVRAIRRLKLT